MLIRMGAEVLAKVDERIAVNVGRWPSLTRGRLAAKVDAIVARVAADAVRRRKERQVGREVWISAESGEPEHPHFGGVNAIYNVIDFRQEDPQNNVIEALRGLGYTEQADNHHHFSYAFVVLTARCAEELGYQLGDEREPF